MLHARCTLHRTQDIAVDKDMRGLHLNKLGRMVNSEWRRSENDNKTISGDSVSSLNVGISSAQLS